MTKILSFSSLMLMTVSVFPIHAQVSFAPQVVYAVGTRPMSVEIGDFNNDGAPDLAVVNWLSSSVSVLLNQGNKSGAFLAQQTFAVGGEPYMVAVGDFNGDGALDLAVPNFGDNNVSVLLNQNNQTGNFYPDEIYGVGQQPIAIAVGDFNDDGNLDIATANFADNTISILLNAGGHTGTFLSPQTYNVGQSPQGLTVGDFNGDGAPDLASANANDNTISVLLNKADKTGSFLAQETYSVGQTPISIAAGDVNGDGKPDLAVGNFKDNTGSVLLNKGDGSGAFFMQQTYNTRMLPQAVTMGDFNGDGALDLAFANGGGVDASVLINKGDKSGAFLPQQIFGTGQDPHGIATADFDGDGKIDMVVANSQDNTVSVLINSSTDLATSEVDQNIANVYPNPTSRVVHIQTKDQGEAKVYNMTGQLILTKALRSGDNVLDLTGQVKGTYVIRVGSQVFKVMKR